MPTSEVNRASGSKGMRMYVEDISEPNISPAPSAVTITAITAADPPVVTAASHGFTSGDRVLIDGVVGMTEINDLTSAVKVLTSSTFELVELDATDYTTYTSGGTATEVSMHDLCVRNFNLAPGTAAEIDTTTLCSEAKEFVLGLSDPGTATCDFNYDPCCNAVIECEAAARDATLRWFKMVFPLYPAKTIDGIGSAAADTEHTVKQFQAYVQSIGWSTGVDAAISGTMTLRLTGGTVTVGCGL